MVEFQKSAIYLASGLLAYFLYRSVTSRKPNLPGPIALPLFGNFFQRLPYALKLNTDKMILDWSRLYGKIFRFIGLGETAYFISDPPTVKRLLTDKVFIKPDFFQNLTEGLLSNALFVMPTNATWKRHRKQLQPAFGPMHLRKAAQQSVEKVRETIAYWKRKEKDGQILITNIRDDISLTTLDILTIASFDIDYQSIKNRDSGSLQSTASITDDILSIVTRRIFVPRFLWSIFGLASNSKNVVDTLKPFRDMVMETITHGRVKPGTNEKEWNILDRLLSSSNADGDKFSDEEIIGETLGFLGAGLETSSTTIAWAIIELCRNPDVADKIREEYNFYKNESMEIQKLLTELKYLDRFVSEVQRLHSIVFLLRRSNVEPVEILGQSFETGVYFINSLNF